MKKSNVYYYGSLAGLFSIVISLGPTVWHCLAIGILHGVAQYSGMLHVEEKNLRKD